MRVNIPVRSRGWGFRGRRISHAMHPPPTNSNLSLGSFKNKARYIDKYFLIFMIINLELVINIYGNYHYRNQRNQSICKKP